MPAPAADAVRSSGRFWSPALTPEDLTARQQEIVRLLLRGQDQQEIAVALGITYQTLKNHLADIRARAGLSSTSAVVRWALCWRLIHDLWRLPYRVVTEDDGRQRAYLRRDAVLAVVGTAFGDDSPRG